MRPRCRKHGTNHWPCRPFSAELWGATPLIKRTRCRMRKPKKPSNAPPSARPVRLPCPHDTLDRIAEALERLSPKSTARVDFKAADAFVWQADGTPHTGAAGQSRRDGPAQGHRPRPRHADREHRAIRERAAGQQCAALGRPRHGQIIPGQGRPCQRECGIEKARQPEADRNPPRGYREPAGSDGAAAAGALSLHRLLRRPVVRSARTPPTSR